VKTSVEKPALERLVAAQSAATPQLRVEEDVAERVGQGAAAIAGPDKQRVENIVRALPNLGHWAAIGAIRKEVLVAAMLVR
jgi:hypothetical protein